MIYYYIINSKINVVYIVFWIKYMYNSLYIWLINVLTLTFSTDAFSSYHVHINALNYFLMNKGF